jgi:hypothetical protein
MHVVTIEPPPQLVGVMGPNPMRDGRGADIEAAARQHAERILDRYLMREPRTVRRLRRA